LVAGFTGDTFGLLRLAYALFGRDVGDFLAPHKYGY